MTHHAAVPETRSATGHTGGHGAEADRPRSQPADALGGLACNRAAVVVLFVVGAALRLWAVEQARFDYDEAQSWSVALRIARGQDFPARGVPISGSDATTPGPLFYYVMALPQLLSADPRAGSVFTAVLNLLALWLVFRVMRDSAEPAVAACWLVVTVFSPWMVVYGDRVWSANLLLPIGGAGLFALARMVSSPRSGAAALLGFLLVAGFQVHAVTFHLWTVTLVVWLVYRPQLNVHGLLAGLLAGTLTYVPYLAREWENGFANTRLLVGEAGGGARGAGPLLGLFLHYLAFATTDVSYLVARGFYSGFDHVAFWRDGGLARTQSYYAESGLAPLLWATHGAGWLLVAVGLVLTARRLIRSAERSLWDVLFLAGAASLGLLHLLAGRGGFAHYAVVVAPLGTWPLVLALGSLLRRRWWWSGAAYLAMLLPAGWLALRPYYGIDSRQSVRQQNQVIGFILARTGDRQPFELHLALGEGKTSTYMLLAREHRGAAWRASERATDVFTVLPAAQAASAKPPGRVAATATLGALSVIHSRR